MVMNVLLWPFPTFRYLASFLEALEMKMRSNYPLDPKVQQGGGGRAVSASYGVWEACGAAGEVVLF